MIYAQNLFLLINNFIAVMVWKSRLLFVDFDYSRFILLQHQDQIFIKQNTRRIATDGLAPTEVQTKPDTSPDN